MDDRDRALIKMNRCLILIVGFKSDGFELIGDPSDSNNLNRYKYQDRRPGWFHLTLLLSTCVIVWPGGPAVYTIYACDSSRTSSNAPRCATRPEIKTKVSKIVPHRENNGVYCVYNVERLRPLIIWPLIHGGLIYIMLNSIENLVDK